jgi:hypothetical protein
MLLNRAEFQFQNGWTVTFNHVTRVVVVSSKLGREWQFSNTGHNNRTEYKPCLPHAIEMIRKAQKVGNHTS